MSSSNVMCTLAKDTISVRVRPLRISLSLPKTDAVFQVVESRFGTQAVPGGVNFQVDQARLALGVALFEGSKCLTFCFQRTVRFRGSAERSFLRHFRVELECAAGTSHLHHNRRKAAVAIEPLEGLCAFRIPGKNSVCNFFLKPGVVHFLKRVVFQ